MTVRLPTRPRGARGSDQERRPKQERGRRMSALAHGLDPQDEAASPQALGASCAALDIGTSKIVCLIARLKPRPPQDVLRAPHAMRSSPRHRPYRVARHEGAARSSIIEAAEEMIRHAVDLRRAHGRRAGRIASCCRLRRAPLERTVRRDRAHAGADGQRRRHRARARRRQPAFGARRPRGAAFAADRLRARRRARHPRSARHARPAASASTCMW